jgi:hypothetical protein
MIENLAVQRPAGAQRSITLLCDGCATVQKQNSRRARQQHSSKTVSAKEDPGITSVAAPPVSEARASGNPSKED